ncbi:MAG: MFS transporter [Myxococcales bacterium]|nr:MFS transporter [Myxococcales bacterium]
MHGPATPEAEVPTPEPTAQPRRVPSPLKNRQYRWLLGSNVTFFLALHGQSVVRSWLAFELTGSKLALGQIAAAVAVPMLLMAPFGGVIADRMERRRLILVAQGALLASESTMLALLVTDRLRFWHLLCATVLMGLLFPISMPARQAIAVKVVGREALTAAMAISMGAISATRVLGPLVSGLLIDSLGVQGAYALGVGLYTVAMFTLLGVPRDRAPALSGPRPPLLHEMAEGFRFLLGHRLLRVLMLFGLVPMFLAMPTQQLMVVFAQEVWNVGSAGFGVLQGISGAGGVVGAVVVAGMQRKASARLRVMMVSGLGFALLLGLFALSPYFWPAVALALVGYTMSAIYSTLNGSAIQLLVPDAVRGRVSSFMMMSVSLPLLGALPVGALADQVGAPAAVASACGLGAVAVVLFWITSPTLRGLDKAVADSEAILRQDP